MSQLNPTREDFAALLDSTSTNNDLANNAIVKGKDISIIDACIKVEGRVTLKEFGAKGANG